MKQVYQIPRSGEIILAEVPTPCVSRGSVLVRVTASVISTGTERVMTEFAQKSLIAKALARPDLVRQVIDKTRRDGIVAAFEAASHKLEQPQALGYSCAGTVVGIGEDVADLKIGDRVACGGGDHAGHAEVVCVPKNLVVRIPETGQSQVSFEEAAFTTIGAVAVHGLRLSEIKFGETVAVLGLGLIGLLTVQLVRAAGAIALGMDPNPSRADLARQLGCAATVTSDEEFRRLCQAHTNARGADAVIICAASEDNSPVVLAAEVARSRARIVSVGAIDLELPRRIFFEKELSFVVSRSYGPGRYDAQYEEKGVDYPIEYVRWTEQRNMEVFLDFVARGLIDLTPLITHRLEFAEVDRAYDIVTGGSGEGIGVVLRYAEEPQMTQTVVLRPAATKPEAQVSLGIIGAGEFAGRVLIPEFARAGAALEGLCTLRGISAFHTGSKFAFRYCTTDFNELLRDGHINAIVIATPHHLHAAQILSALKAGKHVFCEKPLCLTQEELQQIREFYEGTQEPRPVLTVGYNRRFASMIREAKQFCSAISEPLVITYRVNAGFIPRDSEVQDFEIGGGRILGEACHFIDTIHFLAGSTTKRVIAKSLPNEDRYSDDNLTAMLELDRGSIATIIYTANGDRAAGKERIEISGGGRSIILDDFKKLEIFSNGHRKVQRSFLRRDKGHRHQCAEFVTALTQGVSSPISFEEILSCTATTLALAQGIKTGNAVELRKINAAESGSVSPNS